MAMAGMAAAMGGSVISGIGDALNGYANYLYQKEFMNQYFQQQTASRNATQDNYFGHMMDLQTQNQKFQEQFLTFKNQLAGMNTPSALMASHSRLTSSDGYHSVPPPVTSGDISFTPGGRISPISSTAVGMNEGKATISRGNNPMPTTTGMQTDRLIPLVEGYKNTSTANDFGESSSRSSNVSAINPFNTISASSSSALSGTSHTDLVGHISPPTDGSDSTESTKDDKE